MLFALPGEPIDLILAKEALEPQLEFSAGDLRRTDEGWRWNPGLPPSARASLVIATNDASIRLKLFVLTPFDPARASAIDGFQIGQYPSQTTISGVPYVAPRGLLKITEATQDMFVSPHFRLRQFLCKQEGGWPKYIVPNEKLYGYLEKILAQVKEKGLAIDTLHIMSGYRTPFYNARIDNVDYSRHIYGDAADIFIDADGDGTMDDLNGDGSANIEDAELFAVWIREALTSSSAEPLPGGLGVYAERSWRGPFVHFDIRGFEAIWTSR